MESIAYSEEPAEDRAARRTIASSLFFTLAGDRIPLVARIAGVRADTKVAVGIAVCRIDALPSAQPADVFCAARFAIIRCSVVHCIGIAGYPAHTESKCQPVGERILYALDVPLGAGSLAVRFGCATCLPASTA